MKRLAFAVLLLAIHAPGQTAVISHPVLPAVGYKVEQLIKDGKLVGATTLVAREGEIVHLQAHGLADKSAATVMATDSIFRVHSMSKGIITAAAFQWHERGAFELDDPISKWIPGFESMEILKGGKRTPATRPITVADLMRHTAGLTYGFQGGTVGKLHKQAGVLDPGKSLAETVELIATLPLLYEPGTDWSYGVATDVLGRLVEIWSQKEIATILREELTGPLGMADTDFHVPSGKRDRVASLYFKVGPLLVKDQKSVVPEQTPQFCMPGGGLYSTAEDYARFLQMIADGGEAGGRRYLKQETVDLMTTNQLPEGAGPIKIGGPRQGIGYGLGFNVVLEGGSSFDKAAMPGEFGWGGAASCHYWVRPEDRLIVITLEQTMPYSWALERGLKRLVYDEFRQEREGRQERK